MSNTVKIGTIFLACLLNLFQAAALKESIPSTNPRLEKIKWDNSLTLPDLDGKPNIGVAGAFSGFIDKVTTKKWNTEECSNRIDLQRFHLSCRFSPTPPQSLQKPNQDVATLLVRNHTI